MIARLPVAALASVVLLALPLSACGKKDNENDKRTASGEVLPGSISDSMLPLETLTSEPPLAKVMPSTGGSGAADEAASGEADASDAGDSAAAAPEAAPSAKPSAAPSAKPSPKPSAKPSAKPS